MLKSRLPIWLIATLLALVTLAEYWPATHCDFVNYDDQLYVTENNHVQKGLTWENMKWACVSPVSCNWHPLTVWSHELDCQLFGLKPWGHHLTSVVLHALNAGLVFALLRLMTGAPWRSLLVAVLFALHPLRVESVAWVSERKGVLSAFFGLLALIAYARYAEVQGLKSKVQSPKSKVQSQWSVVGGRWSLSHLPSSIFYLLSLLLFALGLMSKPMLVTWPFVLLLLDYWPLRRLQLKTQDSRLKTFLPLLLEKLPFFALTAISCVVTFVVQQRGGAMTSAAGMSLGARLGNALISYCRYLGKLFWPANLAVYYPHPWQWPPEWVALAAVVLLSLSALIWLGRRRYLYLLTGWLWFIGMLVPVIGLVQVGEHAMADRYTYLPSLGVLILAVWGTCDFTRGWRCQALVLPAVGGAAIVSCLVLTRQQIGCWKDSESLFRHAVIATENNALAHNSLGVALRKQGRIDEALNQFQEALRLVPGYEMAHVNLGIAFDDKGQTDAAIAQYQEALRLKPDYAEACYNLGNNLFNKGQTGEAIRQFQEALRLQPDLVQARISLGNALGKEGQTNEAIGQFQEALRLNPDCPEAHYYLGKALDMAGQNTEAILQLQEALHLKPEYALAHKHLGVILARTGQVDEAIRQFQEALRLKPDDAEACFSLGNALVTKGQLVEAGHQFQEALRLKPDYAEARNNLAYLGAEYVKAVVARGNTLAGQGKYAEAIQFYRAALKAQPDQVGILNNFAWLLAACPEAAFRDGPEAVRLATRACELTGYTQPLFIGTLAAAQAEAGDFPAAIASAERAAALADSVHQEPVAARNRELLQLYRQGQPFHETQKKTTVEHR